MVEILESLVVKHFRIAIWKVIHMHSGTLPCYSISMLCNWSKI